MTNAAFQRLDSAVFVALDGQPLLVYAGIVQPIADEVPTVRAPSGSCSARSSEREPRVPCGVAWHWGTSWLPRRDDDRGGDGPRRGVWPTVTSMASL